MTTVAAPGISTTAAALRRLYFVRFAFALMDSNSGKAARSSE